MDLELGLYERRKLRRDYWEDSSFGNVGLALKLVTSVNT